MKTLKLKMLAASMFACATAFGQANQGQGAPSRQPVYQTNPSPTPTADGQGARSTFTNDAYIMQANHNQYASQDQTGLGNSADIYQGVNNGASNTNNAYQTQSHNGTTEAAKNVAYIDQEGTNSTARQQQYGGGNIASIQQGSGDYNYTSQAQTGDRNRAYTTQSSGFGVAYQTQSGTENFATTDQSSSRAYSSSMQSGNNNAAIVNQH
jgi:hypothetical protein